MGKAKYEAKLEPIHPHFCVDCGKPTPDHRCRKCLYKWRKKHHVSGWNEMRIDKLKDDEEDSIE